MIVVCPACHRELLSSARLHKCQHGLSCEGQLGKFPFAALKCQWCRVFHLSRDERTNGDAANFGAFCQGCFRLLPHSALQTEIYSNHGPFDHVFNVGNSFCLWCLGKGLLGDGLEKWKLHLAGLTNELFQLEGRNIKRVCEIAQTKRKAGGRWFWLPASEEAVRFWTEQADSHICRPFESANWFEIKAFWHRADGWDGFDLDMRPGILLGADGQPRFPQTHAFTRLKRMKAAADLVGESLLDLPENWRGGLTDDEIDSIDLEEFKTEGEEETE